MDDLELLREYATTQSESAFAKLVDRHAGLVYSAARRQMEDPQLAGEVTQAVFLILSRKAASMPAGTILSGWLVRTTRYAAANAIRREQTRQRHEREVMNTALHPVDSHSTWDRISPLLDEALVDLREKDRDALVLRFFEQKSFRDIGRALRTSEDSAQKRVSRALAKLRDFFASRGHTVPTGVLVAALVGNVVQAAPAGLAGAVVASVGAQGAGAVAAGAGLCELTLRALAFARFKWIALRTTAVLLVVGSLFLALRSQVPVGTPVVVQEPANSEGQTLNEPTGAGAGASDGIAALQPGQRRLAFRVLDATNDAPMAGVKLTLKETDEYPNRVTSEFVTDRNGFALLPPASHNQKNWGYQIEVYQDGYVPKYVSWSASQGDAFETFPEAHTTKLERGVTIGGIVRGEAGEAIPGVRLSFSVMGEAPGASRDRERLTMMGEYHEEKTDEEGRWSCNHVPELFGMVSWRLIHREYQDVTYGTTAPEAGRSLGSNKLPKAEFLARTAVMTMKRGLVVSGIVTGDGGAAVENARVTLGRDFRKAEASVLTGVDGKFTIRNARPREAALTVQAEGFAPQDRMILPKADLEEQRFVLNKGGVLRGRVESDDGVAIPKATIAVTPRGTGRDTFEWRGKTDSDGRFEWLNAPLGTNAYSVGAGADYDSKSGIPLWTGGGEHIITLMRNTRKRLMLTARAVDAETRQPIQQFVIALSEAQDPVTNGTTITGWGFSYPKPSGEGSAGIGRAKIGSYTTRFVAEVQAEGYLPARATNVNSGQEELTLDFRLKRGDPVRGRVITPEGRPLSGATVVLPLEMGQVQMHFPRQFQMENMPANRQTRTDAEGRFILPAMLDARNILIWHDLGFAEVRPESLGTNDEVVLRAWGGIQGTAHSGGKALVGRGVRLETPYWRGEERPTFTIHRTATTDAEGRFMFDGVPPGVRKVGLIPEAQNRSVILLSVLEESVNVLSGKITPVVLGTSGRTVIGRVSAGAISRPVDWQKDVHTLKLALDLPPEALMPDREKFVSQADYLAALAGYNERSRAFWLSEVGRAQQRRERTHVLNFGADGSFAVNDIPPGRYEMTVIPTEPSPVSKSRVGAVGSLLMERPLGILKIEVRVDEADAAGPSPVLDLGVLSLKPTVRESVFP